MIHSGNLIITADNCSDFKNIAEITGYLEIKRGVTFDAPALTSVGGDVYVYGKFDAPALNSVGGYVSVYGKFDAPALTSVGGDVYVYGKFDAPALTSVGGYVSVSGKFDAPALTSVYGVPGKLLAVKDYWLWKSNEGKYYAGCKRGFSKDQCISLAQSYEDQETAQLFINAIIESEK